MLRKTIIPIASAFVLGTALLAGCGSANDSQQTAQQTAQQSSEATTEEALVVDEGADTKCEITGYTDLAGKYEGYFPKQGDKIAVISPSALPTEEQRDASVEGLKNWGYEPVEGKYTCVKERTLENCIEDLEWALNDPEIKAVYCVRGGHASSEVMDEMSKDLIASAKKPIIGYSDISVYHSAWSVVGLPSVHSSMSATFTDLPEECAEVQKHLIAGEAPLYKCAGSKYDKTGSAEGVLIGGNLSSFMTALNTDYDATKIDEPYILFLEDVNINTEYIHRCLTILKHEGVLEKASGIVFGEWAEFDPYCDTYSGNSRGGEFTSAADMISRQFTDELDIPVAFGFPAGHATTNYPLLMGVNVKLDVGGDGFTLEWSE